MINIIKKILNLIYTRCCYFCKSDTEDSYFCSKCYSTIKFRPLYILKKIQCCNVFSAAVYDGVIKKLIKDLKYYNKKKLAFYHAKIMYDYWRKLNIKEDYLILPVPIHKNRQKERKYNHMDLVADEFSKLTGYKVNKNFLKRIKDTKKQYNLKKEERIQNIRNAFDININENIDKNVFILLIDDVTATGITLEENIKVLQKNGYNNITAFTLSTPDLWN